MLFKLNKYHRLNVCGPVAVGGPCGHFFDVLRTRCDALDIPVIPVVAHIAYYKFSAC